LRGNAEVHTVSESRILVIDHKRSSQELYTKLAERGYQIYVHMNSEDIDEQIQSVRPQALILDAGLPGFNALEFCRAHSESMPHVPALLVAERVEPMLREWAHSMGILDLLSRNSEELAALVWRVDGIIRERFPEVSLGETEGDILWSLGGGNFAPKVSKPKPSPEPVPEAPSAKGLLEQVQGILAFSAEGKILKTAGMVEENPTWIKGLLLSANLCGSIASVLSIGNLKHLIVHHQFSAAKVSEILLVKRSFGYLAIVAKDAQKFSDEILSWAQNGAVLDS
jgi:DNA-binding response OmpR family regulator